jgi:hypothetical protein
MENQKQMRGDGLGVEREEKVPKDKSSQHGTKHLLLKKNHQRLKSSHNVIIYNTCTTTRSLKTQKSSPKVHNIQRNQHLLTYTRDLHPRAHNFKGEINIY